MTEREYLNKIKYCKEKNCPNLSCVYRMIDGISLTHYLPVCNYSDSCTPVWIGEKDYCDRFEESFSEEYASDEEVLNILNQ